jgi:hypothetical protein
MSRKFCVLVCWLVLALLAGCRSPSHDASDWRIPSALSPAEQLFVTGWGRWPQEVAAVAARQQVPVVTVRLAPADGSLPPGAALPWVTDQWLFGYRGGRPAVAEFPRRAGLEQWGHDYFARAGWTLQALGTGRGPDEQRFDAGGSVLALPASGNRDACGGLVISAQLAPEIRRFLKGIGNGRVVELDTRWLKVGHVDEVVSVVPWGTNGFRIVLPDAVAGLKLLELAPATNIVFGAQSGRALYGRVTASTVHGIDAADIDFSRRSWKYIRILSGPCAGLVGRILRAEGERALIDCCWDLREVPAGMVLCRLREGMVDTMPIWRDAPPPGSEFVAVEDSCLQVDASGGECPVFLTVGELRRDEGLHAAARQVQERVEGPDGIRATLCRALGVTEANFLRLPVLFSGQAQESSITALVPNPINLVMLGNTALLLKPFGPRVDPARGDSDVYEAAWRRILAEAGVTPVFLDGWEQLHRLNGGARCGINVMRRDAEKP